MTLKLFGTDGIRGIANKGVMNVEITSKIGMAAGSILLEKHKNHKPKVIIGKDTRLSGYMFETALTAGLIATGIDVFLVGPLPTPAIGMLVKSMRADMGFMISASHNPYYDNGIKILAADGHKIDRAMELLIEERVSHTDFSAYYASYKDIGKAKRIEDARGRYVEFLKNTLHRDTNFEELKVVLDCSNGAAYHLAGQIFLELGAEVIEIGSDPDGLNINHHCGSNHPEMLQEAVLKNGADIGFAFDGDADRVVAVDENGQIIDGDNIIALLALDLLKRNALNNNKVVGTVMSGMGLGKFLASKNIELIRSEVGDKNVAVLMKGENISLGGEPSGHIILGDYSTTGDGILVALQITEIVKKSHLQPSTIFDLYAPSAVMQCNIELQNINALNDAVIDVILKASSNDIGDRGRVVIRRSGTEPCLRVFVESDDKALLEDVYNQVLASLVALNEKSL